MICQIFLPGNGFFREESNIVNGILQKYCDNTGCRLKIDSTTFNPVSYFNFLLLFFPFEINIRNISHGIEIVPIRLRDPTCSRTARFRLPGTKILDVFTEGSLIKLNRRTNRIEAWQFRIRLFAKIIERNAYLWFIQWNL